MIIVSQGNSLAELVVFFFCYKKEHFNKRNLVHGDYPGMIINTPDPCSEILVCNSMQFTGRTTFSTQNKKSTSKTTAHIGLYRAQKTSAASHSQAEAEDAGFDRNLRW